MGKSEAESKVLDMSEEVLLSLVCEIAGRIDSFTSSWSACMSLAEDINFFRGTKYLIRTQSGRWMVKEKMTHDPIAVHESGPMAVCRAIAIREIGKGETLKISDFRG